MQGAQDTANSSPRLARADHRQCHRAGPRIVFDPASGSGGMFVQSSHFIEQRGQSAAHRVTFFGQEYKTSNLRLAR